MEGFLVISKEFALHQYQSAGYIRDPDCDNEASALVGASTYGSFRENQSSDNVYHRWNNFVTKKFETEIIIIHTLRVEFTCHSLTNTRSNEVPRVHFTISSQNISVTNANEYMNTTGKLILEVGPGETPFPILCTSGMTRCTNIIVAPYYSKGNSTIKILDFSFSRFYLGFK